MNGTILEVGEGKAGMHETVHIGISGDLNPGFSSHIATVASGLRIAGVDAAGTVRAVELPGHRFFVATLFQPQLSSSEERPHPLVTAYLRAART